MKTILTLNGIALKARATPLSAALQEGGSLCVMGPSGSGKSRFLEVLTCGAKPVEGTVSLRGGAAIAKPSTDKKATPNSLARKAAGASSARAGETLHALGLWDDRSLPLAKLSTSRMAACEVAEALSFHTRLFAIDGQLDLLDPWTLQGALNLIKQRLGEGTAVIVSTNRTELAAQFEMLAVMAGSRVRFYGTLEDLFKLHGPSEVEIETSNPARAKAVVDAFEVSMQRTERGLLVKSAEGRELAAKLLVHGYGDVRSVLVREPTVAEAVLALV